MQVNKYCLALLILLVFSSISCEREESLLIDTPEETTFTILNGKVSGLLPEADSPYHVTEGFFVDSLQELTIEPGARIFFDKKAKLIIKGNLFIRGSKRYPVVFTAYSDSGWGGIVISGTSAEFRFCRIEKIMIGANDSLGYGGILVTNSNFIMNNCIVKDNRAVNGGGLYFNSSSGKISNNIFKMNYSEIFGGAILSEESSLEIFNNLFYENKMDYYGGGVVLVNNDTSTVQNNIFYKNSAEFGNAAITIVESSPEAIDTAYNFLSLNEENPEFLGENDFHLKLQSPCRNAGNPDSEFNDYDGSRNDQGAYGGPLGDW
jgi:hypothetical protein